MSKPLEEKWAVFQAASHNSAAGRVGPSYPSQSSAILNFMKTYDISKEQWDKGVESKKYDCRKIVE